MRGRSFGTNAFSVRALFTSPDIIRAAGERTEATDR
jgi:hypothetical protein